MQILMIDDDPVFRSKMAAQLQLAGHEVGLGAWLGNVDRFPVA